MLSVPLFCTVDPGPLVDHTGVVRDPRDDFSSGGFKVIHYEENAILSREISASTFSMKSNDGSRVSQLSCTALPPSRRMPCRRSTAAGGGGLKDSVGIPEEQLREAARLAVCKINIDSDGRIVMTAKIREIFYRKPEEVDPRKYLGPARDALREMYARKNREVLGSAGRAPEIMVALKGSSIF